MRTSFGMSSENLSSTSTKRVRPVHVVPARVGEDEEEEEEQDDHEEEGNEEEDLRPRLSL
jgi:hypothetical protein